MTRDQLNSLRPGNCVRMRVSTTTWTGTVIQIWRNDTITIRWSDGVVDSMAIDEENARRLEA